MTALRTAPFEAAMFDVGGVLVESPHHVAWRVALTTLMDGEWCDIRGLTDYSAERFTHALFEQLAADLPLLAAAQAILEYFGVPDADLRATRYAAVEQERVATLTGMGQFAAFADGLRFVLAVKDLGIPIAANWLSRGTELFVHQIRLDGFAAGQGLDYSFVRPGLTLFQLFDATVPERAFSGGTRDPAMFLATADELGVPPSRCLVVEAAMSGIEAAKAAKMAALGVARVGDPERHREAGADLVVTTLDDVSVEALGRGRLEQRRGDADHRRPSGRRQAVWSLAYDGFDPEKQGLREALCALGNGYFVTRGALPEARADGVNYPGTYVAGLYNRLQSTIAGRSIENEDLVNVPNWLPLSFRVADGPWFDVRDAAVLEHRLELDLRRATLTRYLRWNDPSGRRTSLLQRRIVSMKDSHLAGLENTFTAENWSGTLEIRSGLDGRIVNSGVPRYQNLANRHVTVLHAGDVDEETVALQAMTCQSRIQIAVAARTRVFTGGLPTAVGRRLEREEGYVGHVLTLDLEQGRPVTVEKIAALYTSRDRGISESLLAAGQAAQGAPGFGALAARHEAAWEALWNRFDIEVDTASDRVQMILHLHTLHLLQTVSPNSMRLDVGVPARGWHGEAYRGHIFWDEMFVFPFLNFQHPVLAGSLLDYRFDRLGTARAAARAAGYRGAMFPWQAGSDGREETQRLHLNPRSGRWLPDNSSLQRHVNIAVAYNVWLHYVVTGSIPFLRFAGAEMLIEIARFWASAATYNPQLDRYEILGVMGPDEYHDGYPGRDRPGLDNNTYTNVMAVWVLLHAMQALDELPPHYRDEVIGDLALGADEIARWRDITRKMRVVFHQDGVLSQFEGYEDLEEFDWEGYRAKYGNIQRLDRVLEAEGDSTNRYKLSKQADVLMLLILLSPGGLRRLLHRLGYEVTGEQLSRTVSYYLGRTAHGSTLSSVVSAWVLLHADPGRAWEFFSSVLESDVADIQGGSTAEGIHLGAMAGTLDLVMLGLTGMRAHGDTLRFDPALLPESRQLRFSFHYRGHRIRIMLAEDRLTVSSSPGRASPVTVLVGAETRELAPGTRVTFRLRPEFAPEAG